MMLLIGKRKKSRGFLLVELMVTISILSIGLLFVISSFTRSIRAMALSMDYFKANLLLENKLFELYNTEITEGSSDGEFPDFNKRFSWNLGVTKTEDLINEVILKVLWKEKNIEQDVSIATLMIANL